VTRDISISLGIPFSIAEGLKKSYGSVMPQDRNRGEIIPLGERRNVNYKELYSIIEARVEEIFKLVLADISQAKLTEGEVSNLVLCGGSANLTGIAALAQEMIGVPTRVAYPRGVAKVAVLHDPAFATGVGLLLWGAKQKEEKDTTLQGVLKRFFSRLLQLWHRRGR
jgi:cell division protein FtsA